MLGVRSHANSILLENFFRQQAMSDRSPLIKKMATKFLTPAIKVVEEDCKTLVGRNVSSDDDSMLGLLALDTNTIIDEEYLIKKYEAGIFDIRVRDSSACTSKGGVCRRCLHGTYVRLGMDTELPAVGVTVQIPTEPSSLINHLAETYGGSLIGILPVSAEPLPVRETILELLTTDLELERCIDELAALKVPGDEVDYLKQVTSRLERALMIIGYYGVYGNATA